MNHVVRASLISLALLVALVTPTLASTTSPFVGVFRETFGRGNAPSGVGSVTGIGQGTETFVITSITPDGNCTIEVAESVLTFAAGEIFLEGVIRICSPGGSSGTPGSHVSWGNPGGWIGTFVITGGTGAFVGATGSGKSSGQLAGDIIVLRLNGTITLS